MRARAWHESTDACKCLGVRTSAGARAGHMLARGTRLQGAHACKEHTPAWQRHPSAQPRAVTGTLSTAARVPSAQPRAITGTLSTAARAPSVQPRAVTGTLSTAKGSRGYPQHSQGQSRVPSAQPRAVTGTLSTAKGSQGYPQHSQGQSRVPLPHINGH